MSKAGAGAKEMAELLRSGAKMLSYSCPQCGSPLFQLKSGEIWCANCHKRVIIVPEAEGEAAETKEVLWESLEQNLVDKVSSMNKLISAESDPAKFKELSEVISSLLGSIERVRRIKKS
jgi:UPF0148 protein